jgi:hypothetical protein
MHERKLEKFHGFLDRITKNNNKHIVQTCRDGFDLIYKADTSTNPYAQDDTIEQPDAIFTIDADTKRQVSDLDEYTQKMVNAIIDKFGVTADEIHDNYLIFHTKLTVPQYFKHVMDQDTWESKAYYSNDEDEYYAKTPEKYATTVKNKYRNHGHSSGL